VLGAILGAIAGMMQHLSVKQASGNLSAAASFLDVRRAFKTTSWGRRYIIFLYISKVILGVAAVVLVRELSIGLVFNHLAGYFTLMLVREIVTLRDTFYLASLPG